MYGWLFASDSGNALAIAWRGSMNRYFLDESGHGGDLASSAALDFSGQPVFALACVGVPDEEALVAELERLRTKHRCGAGELKSSGLGAKLPVFASDLIEWLVEHDAALFVEIVEKRYFLAIHIVNRVLCGPYTLDEVDQVSRSMMAEFLNGTDFDDLLLKYLGACRSQSIDDIRDVVALLWTTLDRSDEDIARTAQVLTMYARDRVQRAEAKADDFLPLADESVTGKKVWMLPNLQCLVNAYGRVNQSRLQGLDGVTLVHDEQLQYGKVLEDAKALLEELAAQNAMPITPFSDYQLRGHAALVFATDADEPCLQAADILAGCAMRFARTGMQRKGRSSPELARAFFRLLDAGDSMLATGINMVISDPVLQRLQVPHILSAPFMR